MAFLDVILVWLTVRTGCEGYALAHWLQSNPRRAIRYVAVASLSLL